MKEAVILAGGLGTRLQSVVNDRPKCMALVAEQPFLKYLFDDLEKKGFAHVVLSLGYKSDIVLEWISGMNYSFEISYVIEDEPLGTGGAILFASQKIKGDLFFVLNGDTYFDVNTSDLVDFQALHNADISIGLKPMLDFDRYGSVEIDNSTRIIRFNEKQYQKEGLINGGVYLVNKKVLRDNKQARFSFEKDILENKIDSLKIYGLIQDKYFIDIGIPTDYKKANIDFLKFDDLK